MDWDQIENKWAAMTLRVRADWGCDRIETKAPPVRRAARADVTPPAIADRQTAVTPEAGLKMSVE